ncbi:MAG: metalloregulator ArsR/SmtB family transcription factor [Actinomycetota bacterium]|nr:metalloregulator ArsR/SmtB family transcription factor [Actinomycetota bacterium]
MLDLELDRVLHALADPTRRSMVERISAATALSATGLAEPMDISLAAVVQHLKILEECGVIRTEKIGRIRSCRLQPEALSLVASWMHERRRLWELKFDRLGELLADDPADESESS